MVIALAAIAVFAGSSPASADASQNKLTSLTRSLESSVDAAAVLNPTAEERDELVDRALGAAAVQGEGVSVPAEAEFYTLSGNEVIVAIPVVGDGLAFGSGLVTFFTKHLQVDLSLEVEYKDAVGGGGSIRAWVDESLQIEQSLTAEQVKAAMSGVTVRPMAAPSYWDQLSACLASKGLPQTLLAIAGALCAVSCAITAGVMCLVCLGALIVGYGTLVTDCVNEVNAGQWD